MPRTITSAKFQKLLPDAVEMETVSGERVHLDRTDIDAPTALNPNDDRSVTAWFEKNPEVLVIYTRVDPQSKYLAAKRFSLLSTPVLMRVASYRIGEAYEMRINDTNARLYAHGELADGLEGRCEKHSIRKMLKDRGVLPLRQPEGHSKVGAAELAAAPLEYDQFWQLHYPEHELNPGDTVVGLLTGFEFGDDPDSLVVLLDVPGYVKRLKPGSQDVFERLGLTGDPSASVQESGASTERESDAQPSAAWGSVLVLDDDLEGDLKHMVGFLRKMRLDVTSCATRAEAETAVSRLREKHGENAFFDLALVDINLYRNAVQADYEGIRFARWLQERMPDCAIALVSGAKGRITDEAFREIAGDLLVVDYLSKPFTMQTFRSWLRQVPRNRRIPASDLLAGEQASAREIGRRMAEARQVRLESIVESLGRLRDEIQADKATLFRMHKVSRAVSIVADIGEPFPRLAIGATALRYSPIRDVCEDRQERCDHRVPELWLAKHKKLLAICHPLRPYTSCAACPVPEPPGDEHWYALFAFVFAESRWPGKAEGGFQVRQKVVDLLPGAVQSDMRKVLVSHVMREHASYIAQHLLERWHEATQILQYPFLMTGLATSSVGHDLANSLMGADQAISRLQAQVRAGTLNAKGAANELAFLADRTTKAIDIATSYKKQARSQYEVPTTVPLQDVVTSVCQGVTFEAERNHVSFEVYGDAAAAIFCQRGAVERILFNLVLNAVQQTGRSLRGGGKVRVEYHYRKGKTGLEAVVRVYDNGPGIQGYRQRTVFTPGETTRPDGSGMGLAITNQEASRLKGTVRVVKSILFCGTCFELALPVQVP